jgi:hypothetical protein
MRFLCPKLEIKTNTDAKDYKEDGVLQQKKKGE